MIEFPADFRCIFGGSGVPKLLQMTSKSEVKKTSKITSQKDPCCGGVTVPAPPSAERADPCYARYIIYIILYIIIYYILLYYTGVL